MFMASSWTGSWPLGVIFTLRRAVFICGDTDVIVPWTMVPGHARSASISKAGHHPVEAGPGAVAGLGNYHS
jgi:hypothetical protein